MKNKMQNSGERKSAAVNYLSIIRIVILISGIIPTTLPFFLSIYGFVIFIFDIFHNWNTFYLFLSFSFGIIGYIGLWRNLIFPNNRKVLNSILLGIGILSCLVVIKIANEESGKNWLESPKDVLDLFIFIWPIIVAAITIILNLLGIKNLEKKQ